MCVRPSSRHAALRLCPVACSTVPSGKGLPSMCPRKPCLPMRSLPTLILSGESSSSRQRQRTIKWMGTCTSSPSGNLLSIYGFLDEFFDDCFNSGITLFNTANLPLRYFTQPTYASAGEELIISFLFVGDAAGTHPVAGSILRTDFASGTETVLGSAGGTDRTVPTSYINATMLTVHRSNHLSRLCPPACSALLIGQESPYFEILCAFPNSQF